MSICNQCELASCNEVQLFPVGTISPEFYVLGDMTSGTESFNRTMFDKGDQNNRYLLNILESVGMNDKNTRMFKTIRCHTENYTKADEYTSVCGIYAMMDIFKTKPKIIISLGQTPTKYLLGDRFKTMSSCRGRLYDVQINGEIFKVLPTHSPSYILYKKDMELGQELLSDLEFANKFVKGELVNMNDKQLLTARNYQEFMDYFNRELLNCPTPSFDLETNAQDARSSKADIVGFSLAPTDGRSGIYVLRKSLDYNMPDQDYQMIVETVKPYINKSTIRVHNCMYEIPFTFNNWNILIENFEDTLVMARMLLGGKTGAGLKDQCILNLGYPDWDKDLGTYMNGLSKMLKGLKPTATSQRWDFLVLKEVGIVGLSNKYQSKLAEGQELDKRCTGIHEALIPFIQVIRQYYPGVEEFDHIMNLIQIEVVALVEAKYSGPISYGLIPSRIISKYGAMDAVATQDLYTHLTTRMSKESKELGIDLFRGYKYWKGHFTVATHMEMSGLYWNEKVANEAYTWYAGECKKSILHMINSGYLDQYLIDNNKHLLKDYVADEALDEVFDILGEFQPMKSCIKLKDGTKITWKNLVGELDNKTGGKWSASKSHVILDKIKDQIKDYEDYMDYKWVFNPASPKAENKQLLNDILVTDDIKLCHFINQLNTLMDNPEFNINRYPMPDRNLLTLLDESRKYNKIVDLDEDETDEDVEDEFSMKFFDEDDFVLDEEGDESDSGTVKRVHITPKDIVDKFKEMLSDMQFRSQEIGLLLGQSYGYRLEDTKEPSLIELNSYYVMSGIDVENPENWTKEYQFLYAFRMWKKCNKMITSYITGKKVGRGQVFVVDKEPFTKGETLVKRKRNYYDGPIDFDKECLVMQSSFKVCSAETGRWQTGMHTIPAGSAIKNIYTSRFENGIMAMPDYSAMEVRVIAGASGCEPMLKVFREGGDIHTNNAALIWGKPPEEITKEERRYSKMGTFALLYGADYRSFGVNFLDGDIAKAKEIFENFFRAFPEIKAWVDKRHEEMRTTGKITTMSQRYINVTPGQFNGDEGKALRASQNYPIQGSGSDMGGYVLYKIHEFIRENNFKSKVVLFIHDSLEIDIHPDEVLALGSLIIPLMNKFPMDEWGMVTTADLALGISLGQEFEVKELTTNDTYTEGSMIIEGYEDCIQPVLDTWKRAYKSVVVTELEEPKSVYVPRGNLWIPKLAVSDMFGTYRKELKIKVDLVIK